MAVTPDSRLTLTVEEAAQLCGVSRSVAYAAVRTGQLPSIRLGRRIVIPRARLLELLGETPGPTNGNGSPGREPLADIFKPIGPARGER